MNLNTFKKAIAVIASGAMLCTALPSAVYAETEASTAIFSTDFEDSTDIDSFSGRGGVEVFEITSDDAYSGSSSMKVSGREKSWNGPQFLVDDLLEPNTEYLVSVAVKAEWYNNVMLSWEYTNTDGERKYGNLSSGTSDGNWIYFEDIKFSFTDDMTNVYLYVECGDTANLYLDDFSIEEAPYIAIQEDIASISDVYSPYFKIGTAITTNNLSSKPFMNLVQKHFDDSLTAGNEMKPDALLDQEACIAAGETDPQISLASARPFLNYCRDNNIPVRGHTLVWHSQTPDWFFKEGYTNDGAWVTEEVMIQRMENYIKNVFAALEEEYPDVDIYAYDVVNEAWTDSGTPRTAGEQGDSGSNNSAWVQVFGDNSFIEYAFTFARKYAPEGCKLYYNDFNEYMPDKTTAIVEMATDLKEKGLIDGIGCQSHLDVTFPGISAYEKAIAAFAETGLDVQITELDATTSDTSEAGLETQAQYYSDIMDVLVKYSDNISAVVFWGVTDDQSWRASRLPLLFDAEFQAKPAYYSIVDGLEVPDVTEPTTEPTSEEEPTTVTTTSDYSDEFISDSGKVVAIDGYSVTMESVFGGTRTYNFASYGSLGDLAVGDTLSFTGYFHVLDESYSSCNISSFEITKAEGITYGDADDSGEVDVNDVVKVMCYSINADAYPLSETALIYADVYQTGDGVNSSDAFSIQKKLVNLIDALPES